MLQLFINGMECDLSGKEKIPVDYDLIDVNEIDKRKSARSYQFNLPLTVRNLQITKAVNDIRSNTGFAYNKFEALLLEDGCDLQIKTGIISSVSDVISVNLYGSGISFFELIKNKMMRELNVSAFNHIWKPANIMASRNNNISDGYIYPIINYGSDENVMGNIARECNTGYLLPALFLDAVLPKIITEAGYTYDNEMLSDTAYNNEPIILPSTKFNFSNKYNGKFNSAAPVNTSMNEYGAVNIIGIDGIIYYTGNYISLPYPCSYQYVGHVSNGNGIQLQDVVECKLVFTANIYNSYSSPAEYKLFAFHNDTSAATSVRSQLTSFIVSPGTGTYTIEIDLDDTISAWSNSIGIKGFFATSVIPLTTLAGATFEFKDANTFMTLINNGEVVMSEVLPDMKQSEFLMDYLLMFNLIPLVNETTKTVTLSKFDNFLNKLNVAKDWSSKIDLSDTPEIEFVPDGYARNNWFRWEKDSNEAEPVGASFNLQINNSNLDLEKDAVQLKHCYTITDKMLLNIDVPRIGIFENGIYKNDKKPRMLILQKTEVQDLADTTGFIYSDGIFNYPALTGAEILPLCRFINPTFPYNLGFANSLSNYYAALKIVLADYKKVKCRLKLNASDISNLDLSIPVYIEYFNSYFIVSIKGYTGLETTNCELIKLL